MPECWPGPMVCACRPWRLTRTSTSRPSGCAGWATAPPAELPAQIGPHSVGRGLRGQLGMVVGRSHLDAVHADEVQVVQLLQQREQLAAAQPARLGRAGARCEARVQAVDVQAQVERRVAERGHALAHGGQHRRELGRRFEPAQLARRENQPALVAHILARPALGRRADAELHETAVHHQALLHRLEHPAAVAAGLAEMVGPGVAVRIEVQHRQRLAEVRAVGPQQAEGDAVVPPQPGHVVPGDQRRQLLGERSAHALQAGVGQGQVAEVGQRAQRRHIEQRVRAVAQHVAGLADGPRAEASARAVGDRAVPGDAGHGEGLAGVGARRLEKGRVRLEGE
mmetsp:Transcript_23911/g.56805  ORF Transcript_23911/g.56805 Transcript_23911/m.56805 type:complete len:339 (-) Transcript_23911:160-1176(-)